MGTDVITYEAACICGKGTVDITQSSPDHFYAKPEQTSYDCRFLCADCDAKYVFDGARAYRRSEVLAKREAEAAWNKARDELNKNPAVQEVIRALAKHFDGMRYMTSRFEAANRCGLNHYALATFRKRWKNGTDYLRSGVYPTMLSRVLVELRRDPHQLDGEVAKVDALYRAIPSANPVKVYAGVGAVD